MLNNKRLNIHIVSTFLCITLQSSPTRTSENGTFLRIEYKCIKHVKSIIYIIYTYTGLNVQNTVEKLYY